MSELTLVKPRPASRRKRSSDMPSRADRFASMFAPAIVDIFAGCGGWSIGAERACTKAGMRDRYVDLMINHWDIAVGVHQANHPLTQHLRANILEVDPGAVLPGRRIAYLHASPDCRDFSKAKGAAPRRKEIRALADVVIVWAGKRRPDVITLENVEEFRMWGPLLDNGQPDPDRRGDEFRRWKSELEALGYVVDHRELRACDYGAPTTRKRLFVIARCDGKPIIWPEKTHGKEDHRPSGLRDFHSEGRQQSRGFGNSVQEITEGCDAAPRQRGGAQLRYRSSVDAAGGEAHCEAVSRTAPGHRRLEPYRTAASCIDWSIPMLSIFATPEEAKAFAAQHGVGVPRRPLQPKTLARIARGLVKFVIEAKRPFIVRCAHGDVGADGRSRWGAAVHSLDETLPTVTASKDFAVVDATIAPFTCGVGGRAGQSPPTSVESPVPTVTAKADRVVCAATLQTLNHGGDGHRGQSPADPMHTVTGARDARALVAALVTKHYGGNFEGSGTDARQPLDTVTATDHNAVTCAYLSHLYGTNKGSRGDVADPAPTITGSSNHAALICTECVPFVVGAGGASYAGKPKSLDDPANTVMTNDRRALVAAFIATYYGEGSGKTGQPVDAPAPTITGKDRIQLVTVVIDGQTFVVTDIAMRMLRPRELARAQGFPSDYIIEHQADGTAVSRADQVKLIGNSVCPDVAEAIVRENVVKLGVLDDRPVAVGGAA